MTLYSDMLISIRAKMLLESYRTVKSHSRAIAAFLAPVNPSWRDFNNPPGQTYTGIFASGLLHYEVSQEIEFHKDRINRLRRNKTLVKVVGKSIEAELRAQIGTITCDTQVQVISEPVSKIHIPPYSNPTDDSETIMFEPYTVSGFQTVRVAYSVSQNRLYIRQ